MGPLPPFGRTLANPWTLGAWHLAFVALVAVISARGVNRGLEIANKIRAPAFLILMSILVVCALATGNVRRGLAFAFAPNFAVITPQIVLAAIGQAFYATGVGLRMTLTHEGCTPYDLDAGFWETYRSLWLAANRDRQ